jgi:hypothetical protein
MSSNADWIHDYFRKFETSRWRVTSQDVDGFRQLLEEAEEERPIQLYLQNHPQLMCCFLRSGHGEWVIPQKRFGSELVADFVIGCGNSGGFAWDLVELESPCAPFLLKNGQPGKQLRTAVHQIKSWRSWIQRNLDYTRRPPSAHGLGFIDMSPRESAMIFIGRRKNVTPEFNNFRACCKENDRIEVVTYDRLLEHFEWICDWRRRVGNGMLSASASV